MKNRILNKLLMIALILVLGVVSHPIVAAATSEMTPEEVFTYSTDGSGNATITGFKTSAHGKVELPENIDGNRVVAVGSYAFENNSTVTEFVIPEGIKQLGLGAFYKCSALEKINIPSTLTAMSESSLTGCPVLKSIVVDPDNPQFDSRNNCNAVIDTEENTLIIGCQNSTIPNTVIEIGREAFVSQSNLKNIEISDSVTCIRDSAFAWCEQLESLHIPGSVKTIEHNAFQNCRAMKELVIQEGVESIDSAAFSGCIGLTELRMPKSVVSVSLNAFDSTHLKEVYLTSVALKFQNNTYLEKVYFAKGIDEVPRDAFNGCTNLTVVELPSTLKSIKSSAFKDCSSLTEIDIPSSVISIEEKAFMGCTQLKEVILPPKIEKIEQYTFAGCHNLENVVLPGNLKEICSYAFRVCSSLKTIDFPETLEAIGSDAFDNCTALAEVMLPPSVESLGSNAFYECESLECVKLSEHMTTISSYTFYDCKKLKTVEMPSRVKEIQSRAFYGCESLQSIEFPVGLEYIGSGAFSGCSNLMGFNLPPTLTGIGNEAFCKCVLIDDVTIPYGVETISYNTFSGCSNLKTVKIPYSVTDIERDAFKGCVLLTEIIIPESVVEIGNSTRPNPFSSVKTIYGADGSYAETFALDNEIEFVPIEMTHEHCYQTIVKKATLEENGFKRIICSICGEKTEDIYYCPVVTIDNSSYVYTGKEVSPKITVKDSNGNHLMEGTDYELSGDDKGLNAGDYSLTVKFIGIYEGTVEKTFEIKPVTAEGYNVKLQYARTAYSGKEKKPKVTVTDSSGKSLSEGTDYSVTYQKGRIKVARYKVTVRFKGNYRGVVENYFTIVPSVPETVAANLNSSLQFKGYDDIKFSWSKVNGASGYDVYFKKASASKYTYMTSITGTSVMKKDLNDGVKYTFKVVPFYKTGGVKYKSLNAKIASVYTLKKIPVPSVTKNGAKVRIKWSNINGETGYQISRTKSKTGTNIVATYKTTTGKYKDVSAEKGKKFYYKVRAYKVVNKKKVFGPWSDVKGFTRK